MKERLLHLWEDLRTSLWFVPSLMTAAAAGLAFVTPGLEPAAEPWLHAVDGLSMWGPEGARSLLSTVASSMITIAGVAFSIMVVALQLASSQLGPRLLRTFMRDTGNQVVLGTFISTFMYCLLAMLSIGNEGPSAVPRLAVTVGVVLALLSLGVLIYFIHHAALSMQAPEVIAAVTGEFHRAIEEVGAAKRREGDRGRAVPEGLRADVAIAARRAGYVRRLDQAGLMRAATAHDVVIVLEYRPGHFVFEGSTLAHVTRRLDGDEGEALARAVNDGIILGRQRTAEQDVEYCATQLVEIALRALSPGINDPFTAVACVDHLSNALGRLARTAFPEAGLAGDDEQLRLVRQGVRFPDVLDAAFRQIRQASERSPALAIRLLQGLARIGAQVESGADRDAVRRHADLTLETGLDACTVEPDRDAVRERYQAVLDALRST
ncbi:MAG: DUF2254 domain-containing protein [Vicinamibacterales bacterium]